MDPVTSDLNSDLASDLPRAESSPAALTATVASVTQFSADLFGSLARSSTGNLVCSPYSIAVVLGSTVQGARGRTAEEILAVLHSSEAAALAEGLNAIDQALAARAIEWPGAGEPERIQLASGNSLWGQDGVRWEQPFLDVLARDFGTGMRVVDYEQSEAARTAVNAWVSQQTRGRIPELIPPGTFDLDTRLTLVNALYFKAPWQDRFEPGLTRPVPFHRLDGSTVAADLMTGPAGSRFTEGPGWVAADLGYGPGDLAMAVIVPDPGRFGEVEESVTGRWLSDLLAGFEPALVQVGLPRWTHRSQVDLGSPLADLGMPGAFSPHADFSAMTTQEELFVSAALHEGFIAVDEAGTEAAAATAAVASLCSFRPPTRTVVADRPFLYVIHDRPTGTPLFLGRVLDPTAR